MINDVMRIHSLSQRLQLKGMIQLKRSVEEKRLFLQRKTEAGDDTCNLLQV